VKLTAPRDVLAALTGWVAATTRTGLSGPLPPVLGGLLLTAEDGTLTVARFGYQVSATARADAEVGEPGRALVPARILTGVVHALPARQPVDLATDGTRVIIGAGPVTYTLLALPDDGYPALPETGAHAAEFDARMLAAAVTHASGAASRDDTLPVLTCIRLTLDGKGTAELAATDRYRLAVATCPYTPGDSEALAPALIPARDLAAVTRRPGGAPIRLAVTTETASVSTADRHVTIRLISGEYPNVTRHIPAPEAVTTTVTADVPALTGAIRRAAVVAERGAPVRLSIRDGEALIESGTADDASLAETVPVALDGDPLAIAFNPGYLLDALAAVTATGSTAARLAMTTATKPAVITPASPTGATGCTYVLMPVKHAG
jgi:DNA polymerase-3 subunit beta